MTAHLSHPSQHLSSEQIEFYQENGYLRIPQIGRHLVDALRTELDFFLAHWTQEGPGWSGAWRKRYMDERTAANAKGVVMQNLQCYGASWNRFVLLPELCQAMTDLLGPNVEFTSTSTHIKASEAGMPFPMHQDSAFYNHQNDRLAICALHLDDTTDENGAFRIVPRSHKQGPLEHITRDPDGSPCAPHLSVDDFPLDRSEPIYCEAGDILVFNLFTIHGSDVNRSPNLRRLVVARYRDPENRQTSGIDAFGTMVAGVRPPLRGYLAAAHQMSYLQQVSDDAEAVSRLPIPRRIMDRAGITH